MPGSARPGRASALRSEGNSPRPDRDFCFDAIVCLEPASTRRPERVMRRHSGVGRRFASVPARTISTDLGSPPGNPELLRRHRQRELVSGLLNTRRATTARGSDWGGPLSPVLCKRAVGVSICSGSRGAPCQRCGAGTYDEQRFRLHGRPEDRRWRAPVVRHRRRVHDLASGVIAPRGSRCFVVLRCR